MSIYFAKLRPFLRIILLAAEIVTLPFPRFAFTSFHNSLRSSIVSLFKSSLMNMLVYLSLFPFCRIFNLSLYLSRSHIIVPALFPLFALFCLADVRSARLISLGHSKPGFSCKTCCSFSSQSSNISPGVSIIPSTLRLFLLDLFSRYISFCST